MTNPQFLRCHCTVLAVCTVCTVYSVQYVQHVQYVLYSRYNKYNTYSMYHMYLVRSIQNIINILTTIGHRFGHQSGICESSGLLSTNFRNCLVRRTYFVFSEIYNIRTHTIHVYIYVYTDIHLLYNTY